MTEQTKPKLDTIAELLVEADSLKRRNDYYGALSSYLKAIERVGEDIELMSAVAHCYFSLAVGNPNETGQNHKEAIVWIEKAVALAPDNARLRGTLAQFYQLGVLDYERAAREYREAIELNPYDVQSLFNASSLYGVPEEVVQLDEAIDWLERATQLEPDDPNYHLRLGELYQEADRQLEANREWLRALLCPQPLPSASARTVKIALGVEGD